jgi:polysaccharide biosynthesis transport protein
MRMHDSMSSPLEIAPVIFPKPPAKDPDGATTRSIHVFESLRRHRIISGITLLVFLLGSGFVIYKRRGPTFEANSRVYVAPVSSKALTDDKQVAAPYDNFMDEQVKSVTRYDIIKAALDKLPRQVWRGFGPTEEIAINVLEKLITVARQGQTFEITITLDGSNAENVTHIVNAVTDAYIAKAHSVEFYDRDQKLAILRDEQSRLQSQIADKETQQTRLLQDLGIASVKTDDASPYNDQLAKLHSDLNDANEALGVSLSRLEALRSGGADDPGMQVAAQDAAATDPGLMSLKTTLSSQRGALIQQMATLTPSNPIYKQDEDQLKSIESQLADNSSRLQQRAKEQITQRLLSDIAQKRIVVDRLRAQLLDQTHLATGSAPKYQQAQQVSADIVQLQTGYAAVEERIRELEVDSSSPGSIYLSAAAMVPLGPAKSKTPLLALILLVSSIFWSVAVAVAIDFFDPHVYNAEDVKQVMGFSPLGVLLDHDFFSAEVSQQYLLRLAAGIHHAVRASGARTFLFTATEPEGGTTTVVEKLARQLRVLNLRTLTVAATNVDGKISYVNTAAPIAGSNQSASSGSNQGMNQDGWRSGPVPADSDKLRTQPIGPLALATHTEPAQTMFSGSFVAQVLAENESNYDVVLVDGGPLLISADTEYLARVADGTIIVAQSGRTTRKQLERAASLLERLHVPGVAVALNRVNPSHADAALRQDVLDFQQQLKKQRGTALSKQYTRRIPQERPRSDEPDPQVAAAEADEGFKKVSAL